MHLGAQLSGLGLANVRVPLFLPFTAPRAVALAPPVTEEDRIVVENVAKIVAFLVGGERAIDPRAVRELLPGARTALPACAPPRSRKRVPAVPPHPHTPTVSACSAPAPRATATPRSLRQRSAGLFLP